MPILTKADLARLAVFYEDGWAVTPRSEHPKGATVRPQFRETRQQARNDLAALPDSLRRTHKLVRARRILLLATREA